MAAREMRAKSEAHRLRLEILAKLSDEEIAKRIRAEVRYLHENLAEAKRRGITVRIDVGHNRALDWPYHTLTEGEPISVREINKTTQVKL